MFNATINRHPAIAIGQVVTGRYRWLLISVVSLLSVIARVLYSNVPFERDEGAWIHVYQSVGLGEYLKTHSGSEATAFVIGSEPQILFYSGLISPTRFFYYYPLATSTPICSLSGGRFTPISRRTALHASSGSIT